MRVEYRREDFEKLKRGRFYEEVAEGTTVFLPRPLGTEEGLEGPDDLNRGSSDAMDAAER